MMTLILSGTDGVQDNSGAIVRGTAITLTNQTAPEFTGIPSWAKRVTVMLNGVGTNGTSVPLLQIGTTSGYDTSGYACVGTTIGASTGATTYTSGFAIRSGNLSAALLGSFVLTNVNSNNWVCVGTFGDTGTTNGYTVGGSRALSGSGVLDRVRLFINGTLLFNAGTINIIYE
jgi:hypothetical protein